MFVSPHAAETRQHPADVARELVGEHRDVGTGGARLHLVTRVRHGELPGLTRRSAAATRQPGGVRQRRHEHAASR